MHDINTLRLEEYKLSTDVPKTHPRYLSLETRHKLIEGWEQGYVADAGLIAHGRGEAFDYLLGEETIPQAHSSQQAACTMLLAAQHPVISVNGNVAALVSSELKELSDVLDAAVEVNLFYGTAKRQRLIKDVLEGEGVDSVLGVDEEFSELLPGLDSNRARVDKRGIGKADVVLVSLEDGDRAEALLAEGKKVVSIDLNPLSRTSQKATVSIVDNIIRAFPNMIKISQSLKNQPVKELERISNTFDNQQNLKQTIQFIRQSVGR